jgi:hypothetical protein
MRFHEVNATDMVIGEARAIEGEPGEVPRRGFISLGIAPDSNI